MSTFAYRRLIFLAAAQDQARKRPTVRFIIVNAFPQLSNLIDGNFIN
jgi:hypothetical protein